MRHRLLAVLFLAALCGCSTARHNGVSAKSRPEPQPYVRVVESNSDFVQLQIAVRKFVPSRRSMPVVWLTGVMHVGDTNYYSLLQKHLDAQSLVLFEGVGGPTHGRPAAVTNETEQAGQSRAANSAHAKGTLASFQTSISSSLGLAFQLDAIDYSRTNFYNSDLGLNQIRQLVESQTNAPGAPSSASSFNTLVQMMEGSSLLGSIVQLAIGALGSNPSMRALTRFAIIESLGQMKGDPSQLRSMPPDMKQLFEVLIQQRNQKVISDLKARAKEVGRGGSIAIFYGAAHMPDLEKHLRKELHYRPVEELWFTSMSVDLKEAGVSRSQRDFIVQLIGKLQ